MNGRSVLVRASAAVAALVMVVVAFAVRGDDGDDATGPDEVASTGQILCPSDLRAPCTAALTGLDEALATAPAGATADGLIEATDPAALDADAWIVPAAWASAVIDERARLGRAPLFQVSDVLVSSPISLAIWESRSSELSAVCTTVDWSCLAAETGRVLAGGDRVTTGVPDVESALGLPLAAAQVAGLVGVSDYASNDFDAIATATARLAQGQRADPLGAMRSQGPGRVTAVAIVDATAPSLSSTFGAITTRPNSPAVRVDLVALTVDGSELDDDVRDAMIEAFVDAGWQRGGDGPDGLPAGGVLAAVRSLWNQR